MQFDFPGINFWFYFFILNNLIVVPVYLLQKDSNKLWPFSGFNKFSLSRKIRLLFFRYNQDIFRVCADLAVIALVLLLIKNLVPINYFLVPVSLYIFLMLVLSVYYSFFRKVYNKEPKDADGIQLFKIGYEIVKHGEKRKFFTGVLMISAILLVVLTLTYLWLEAISKFDAGVFSYGILMFICLMPVIFKLFFHFRYLLLHRSIMFFGSEFFKIIKSVLLNYRLIKQINIADIICQAPDIKPSLTSKPNFIFLFLESYGKILIDSKHESNLYATYIRETESDLTENGWYAATALSQSPVSGGESWIAYSSMLYGFNVQNQSLYEHLLNSSQLHDYPMLFRLLRKNGYTTYWTNGIPGFEDLKVPWDTYKDFYGIDHWIKFNDLKYKGQLYSFGPCPPDQFTINFSLKQARENSSQPFCWHFLTQNSHSPFAPIAQFYNNWKDANVLPDQSNKQVRFLSKPVITDYFKAMEYNWKVVHQLLLESCTENDIIIVAGDHQPPFFTNLNNGTETPVHIISKNKSFIASFIEQGYNSGFQPSDKQAVIKHEGFFTTFINAWLAAYDSNKGTVSSKPDGINIFANEA